MNEDKYKRISHYEYDMWQKPLGRGRMSFIYRGTDLVDDSTVAIKVIALKDCQKTFDHNDIKHDIHFLQQFPSKHIVKFLDLKISNHNLYIITECCEGETLAEYIAQNKHMPELQALSMIKQIAQAFIEVAEMGKKYPEYKHYFHHGELTPSKVMLLKDGTVKIADFGIPTLVEKIMDVMMVTQYTQNRCFPYESPQMLRFEDFGPRSDVWSAGVLLYEALFGRTPWGNDNSLPEQIKKIEEYPVKFDHTISSDVQSLIKHMLKINEKDRLSWELVRDYHAMKKLNSPAIKNPFSNRSSQINRRQSMDKNRTALLNSKELPNQLALKKMFSH